MNTAIRVKIVLTIGHVHLSRESNFYTGSDAIIVACLPAGVRLVSLDLHQPLACTSPPRCRRLLRPGAAPFAPARRVSQQDHKVSEINVTDTHVSQITY